MSRSLRFRVLASLGVLVALSSILETGARLVGAEFPEWRLSDAAAVVMIGHPTRLWALSPGVKRNANETATINALGLRGALPESPKPAGRLRVLVLGDSTWFGHGVSDDETFPARLEAGLRAEGLDVDVVNGGVPGYSTEQTRVQLDELGWSLEPDLILLGNLWSDNNVDSFRDEDLLATARAQRDNPLYASHFFRLLVTTIDEARGGDRARLVTWTRQSQWPEKGGRRVSLHRYAANLDTMVRDAAARGIGAAILAPCNVEMVKDTYRDGASWDVFYDAQRRIAEHHGIPLIETLPAMRAATKAGADPGTLFVDVMHPSPAGHVIFAQAAEGTLRAAGWPEKRLVGTGDVFPAETLKDNRFGVGDPNPSSPQRNLFGSGMQGPPPLGDAGKGRASPGAATAGPSGPTSGPTGGAAGTGAGAGAEVAPKWALSGSVLGGEPPYALEVRAIGAAAGAVVASARLNGAGPFALNVRGDIDDVTVAVTDARGRSGTGNGHRGGGSVEVVIP